MRNEVIVQKLIAYTKKIIAYCKDVTYQDFCGDTKLTEACVFNLSQMGELANKVEPDFAQAHPEIPREKLYGLRNRIVHDYEGVNLRLIWEIIEDDIPDLLEKLKGIK